MVNMKYFHQSVEDYMKAFNEDSSQKLLEKLAMDVLIEVEHTLNPSGSYKKKLDELHIKKRHGAVETDDKGTYCRNVHSKIKWTKKDVDTVQENWNIFCKRYDLANPFWFIKRKGHNSHLNPETLYRFKLYLSHGVQNTSLFSVYEKWQRLICFPKSGKLSEAELSLTHKLMCHCKEKDFKHVLKVVLQRPNGYVLKILKDINNTSTKDSAKLNWPMTLEEELVRCVIDELEAKSVEELNQSLHTWQWTATAKKLGLTRSQVYNHWYGKLHPALIVQQWMTLGELQINLINRLKWLVKKGKVDDWKQVDWTDVGHHVGGFSSLFVFRHVMTMRWNFVKSSEDRKSICETIKILSKEVLPRIKEREENDRGKYLRRLVYDWNSKCVSELLPPHLDYTGMEIDSSS